MNAKQLYGDRIAKVLKSYLAKNETLAKAGFFLFENFVENEMLFIGINPADVKNNPGYSKYSISEENGVYWGKEEFKKEYPRFYKPFDKLACGMKWSHLDLFFSMETHVKVLKDIKGSKFLEEQYNLSAEIIKQIMPKIIVVGSAYASDLVKERFHCDFDNTLGTCRIREFNDIPIFFSASFTGGALDKGSMERIVWHIDFVKSKLKL